MPHLYLPCAPTSNIFVTRALVVRTDYPYPVEELPKEECSDLNAAVQTLLIVAEQRTFFDKREAEGCGYRMLEEGQEADTDVIYEFEDRGGGLRAEVNTEDRLRRTLTVEFIEATRLAQFHKYWGRWT